MMIKKVLMAIAIGLSFMGSAQEIVVPKPDHVVIVVLENTSYGAVLNANSAPYIKSLASDPANALFTNSFGLTHPSQPNYLMMFSGGSQGVSDDNLPKNLPFTAPNLASELIAHKYTFAGYAEQLPSEGSTVEYYGTYARKHSPWVNWQGGTTNGVPTSCNKPFSAFPSDYSQLPTISYVIPTLDHDMHDPAGTSTAISNGDNWVKTHLDAYAQWAKTHNSLLIVTWDEDDNNQNNQITTIFIGQDVKGGKYNQKITHYNVLRTLEEMYGLNYVGNSSTASNVGDVWKRAATPPVTSGIADHVSVLSEPLAVYPNPARGKVSMHYNAAVGESVRVNLFDELGRVVAVKKIDAIAGDNAIEIGENAQLATGMYILSLEAGDNKLVKKIMVKKE